MDIPSRLLCGRCGRELLRSMRQLSWDVRITVTLLVALATLHITAGSQSTYPTVNPRISTFHNEMTGHYRLLQLYPDSDHHLYAGASNYIIRLDMENITKNFIMSPPLNAGDEIENRCRNKFKEPHQSHYCENHIRVIVEEEDYIYACGTGASQPLEIFLDKEKLGHGSKSMNRTGAESKCPFTPEYNSTAIYVTEGNPGGAHVLYTGAWKDERQSQPVIYKAKSIGRNKTEYGYVRTALASDSWLQDPDFVASTERANYVYFFFREVAMEHPGTAPAIYSRIARVCKHDLGGSSTFSQQWCSYLKVRLQCDIPGDMPFYFDEVHDVHQIGETIYGVFSSNGNGIYGSAVCAFSFSDVDNAFDGEFLEKKADCANTWNRVEDAPEKPECQPGMKTDEIHPSVLAFLSKRPLMHDVVRPNTGAPLFYMTSTVYLKLQASEESGYTMIYLATDNGEIHKVIHKHGGSTSRVLSVWKPFIDSTQPIRQLKYHDFTLYASTDTHIGQLAVKQCWSYVYCTQCISDPHCRWSRSSNVCKEESGVSTDWTKDPMETCGNRCYSAEKEHRVRLQGDTLVLPVISKCVERHADSPVVWQFRQDGSGSYNDIKSGKSVIVSVDASLVLLNVTSANAGKYRCIYEDMTLDQHTVTVTDCENEDCVWRKEFHSWCEAYEEYTNNFNHWKCMKNNCVSSNCVPEAEQCEEEYLDTYSSRGPDE